tara:strand:+ start:599 stop:1270 length:672 start_codon:yes stop_codon:yes gene_type:complete
MRNNNWFDNLINGNRQDFAYAYAYVTDPIEKKEEEEVDLMPQFFAFFRRLWRAATNVFTFGQAGRARKAKKRAEEEHKRESAAAKAAAEEYEATRSKLDKDIAGRKAAYDKQAAIEKSTLAESKTRAATAASRAAEAKVVGERRVAGFKTVAQQAERAGAARTAKEAELAKPTTTKTTGVGGPGRTGTKVSFASRGTGKPGATTQSAKKLRKRLADEKTSLNI